VSSQFETHRFARHALGASFFVNNDTHLEQTTSFSRTNVASTTPPQTDRDRQSSFGLQDVIVVSSRMLATLGFSADHLDGLEVQDLSGDKTHVVPFQVAGVCGQASGAPAFTDCTDHAWTYNPVASVSYATGTAGSIFVTVAHKSRFPTLKDRYSYKAGRAIPNPLLEPEHATTVTLGFSRAFALRTAFQVDVFRSEVRDGIQNTFFLSPTCASGGRGGAGTCQQAINVASETHEGINLTLRTTPVAQLTLDASYGYLNREIRDISTVFPTGMPKHKSVVTGTMRLPHRATAMASARYQTGAVGMSDNGLPLRVATFSTVDVGGTMPIRTGLAVQIGVKNLFDQNYYYWEGFPEAGRSAHVSLQCTF
jgi:iron complex outermembrane receptor protein